MAVALGGALLAWLPRLMAAEETGALVRSVPAVRGSEPELAVAYGEAMAASGAPIALSVAQEGEVVAQLVTPGEQVRRGTALLQFRLTAAATSAYRQAESALALARTTERHIAALLAQRLATRDQMAQAQKASADAAAALQALTREGAGQPVQALDAPVDGVVEAFPAAVGDRVAAGTALVTLTPSASLVVTVGIEPRLRTRVRAGQAVRLERLDVAAAGAGPEGVVARVDGTINPKTRLVDVDVAVPEGSVIAGEAFRAEIDLGPVAGWVVPHEAVLDDARGNYLFQIKNGHAVRVDVRELLSAGERDVVAGGLVAGRPVVTSGASQLADGAPVRAAS